MQVRNHISTLVTPPVLVLGLAASGCGFGGLEGPAPPPPESSTLPGQMANTNVEWSFDLSPYAQGNLGSSPSWSVVSGGGQIQGTEYVNTFETSGSYSVRVRANYPAGDAVDADFEILVQSDVMAVVQCGNDLCLFDGDSGGLIPLAVGGASPLNFKAQLPNGWFVYERLGGSSIDLFAFDMVRSYELGESASLNTVYASHTPSSVVLFEQGSGWETGLYAWDPKGQQTETVAWRGGMHNRNPVVSDSEVVYFEYGNNGQPDLYFWTYGDPYPTTGFSSDHPEVIHTVVPNGGVVFSTNDPVTLEADLHHYRMHNGSFTVGGDLRANVQALDMTYQGQLSGGHVVFSTSEASGNEDLWLWSPFGLNTATIAESPSAERFVGLTPDDRVLSAISAAPGNDDLGLYHHTSGANDSVASSPDNELFEAFLPNSDVIFAVETAAGRQLKRFNVVTGHVDVIAATSGADFWLTEVLSNGMVVYTRTGSSPGLHVWNPLSRVSTPVSGAGGTFEADAGHGDFILSLSAGAQSDLAMWDASMSQLVMITQTAEHEQFGCVFDDGT
ncbi:MAG: WD40 repeat domain-containing protein, partial [Planctomycetota bacterium]|nr:WD40 repeat domain-containing protein [Planctomycetota bacterium]